jgi:hypothetical protein
MSKKDITRLEDVMEVLKIPNKRYIKDYSRFTPFCAIWQRLMLAPIQNHLKAKKVSINEFMQAVEKVELSGYNLSSFTAVSNGVHRKVDFTYFFFLYDLLNIPFPSTLEEIINAVNEVEASRQARRDKIQDNAQLRALGLIKERKIHK